MVKRKKITERIKIDGYDAILSLGFADLQSVIGFLDKVHKATESKYFSVTLDKEIYSWEDDSSDYCFYGERWETIEECDARIAAEKAEKKAQKTNKLEKERLEYERLKKKFEK